jgi:DNA repair exonuclease SbcCD ATPase subunit
VILINNNWEDIQNINDVVRLVEENMGSEFAKTVKKICEKPTKELQDEIQSLESDIEDLEDMTNNYDNILQSLEYLEAQLDKLEKYIDENSDGSDYMKGMSKAFDMIEQ